MKLLNISDSAAVADIDLAGLVYLIGELVNPAAPLENRRRALLGGLGEWIGADAWGWARWDAKAISGWQSGMDAAEWGKVSDHARLPLEAGDAVDRAEGWNLCCLREEVPRTAVFLSRDRRRPAFSARESRLAMILLEEVAWLYQDEPSAAPGPIPPRLSPRQSEIAGLLVQGRSRKAISTELGIPENTLASHIRGIYRKYRVRSHAAFLAAFRHGIFPTTFDRS